MNLQLIDGVHETAIGHAQLTASGINSNDPKLSHGRLFPFPIPIRKGIGTADFLTGISEKP
jgi:hypothetical protein